MRPKIIDADTGRELWLGRDCCRHCEIVYSTWTTYKAKGLTPDPVGYLDAKSPLWDAEEIKTWHANRPGSPVPNAPTNRWKK